MNKKETYEIATSCIIRQKSAFQIINIKKKIQSRCLHPEPVFFFHMPYHNVFIKFWQLVSIACLNEAKESNIRNTNA